MIKATFTHSFLFFCFIVCYATSPFYVLAENESLNDIYTHHCQAASDINEHLPTLSQYAQDCSSVTEIGHNRLIASWGILQGLSKSVSSERTYLGISDEYPSSEGLDLSKKLAEENDIQFKFWKANDLYVFIEPTDMLFIDSLHTYCHLTYELEHFAPQVKKYICLHDVCAPWGNQDDEVYQGDYSEYPSSYDRTKRGLWPALLDFLAHHHDWMLVEYYPNNHGFAVLKRVENAEWEPCIPLIDDHLKNTMILCVGPLLEHEELVKRMSPFHYTLINIESVFGVTHWTKDRNLATLDQLSQLTFPENPSDPLVDEYLVNHMILCTGPAMGRYEMLKASTESDLDLIPFKKIYVTTNEPSIMNIDFKGRRPDFCELIACNEKHVDCINCMISTMREAVNDPEVNDDDIILFKHESVFINDMGLIKEAVNKLVNEDYNMVTRNMVEWNGLTATDAFFVKVSAIRTFIHNYPDVPELHYPYYFCEAYFHDHFVHQIPNIYGILYHHSNGGFTELGFYHYPSVPEQTRPYWNRKNRDELFHQPPFSAPYKMFTNP